MASKKQSPVAVNAHRGTFAALRAMQSEGLTVGEVREALPLIDFWLNWTPLNRSFDLCEIEELTAGRAEETLMSLYERQHQRDD